MRNPKLGTGGTEANPLQDGTCLPCEPGRFTDGIRVLQCDDCPMARFAANSSQSVCEPCPARRATQREGSALCGRFYVPHVTITITLTITPLRILWQSQPSLFMAYCTTSPLTTTTLVPDACMASFYMTDSKQGRSRKYTWGSEGNSRGVCLSHLFYY